MGISEEIMEIMNDHKPRTASEICSIILESHPDWDYQHTMSRICAQLRRLQAHEVCDQIGERTVRKNAYGYDIYEALWWFQ